LTEGNRLLWWERDEVWQMLPCLAVVPVDVAGTEKALLHKQDIAAERFSAALSEQGQITWRLVGYC
jgi:hypothetical protein